MKQNEFIQSVIDILRLRGEKYSKYDFEFALWRALTAINVERGITNACFSKDQEGFVRRSITSLVTDSGKTFGWKYDGEDIRRAIIKGMEVGE